MRILTHWNPLRDVQEFQNRVFHALQTAPAQGEGQCKPTAVADWVPVVDVVEDEKEFLITAELPEVTKENVRVTVDKGQLTLSGERKFEKEENGKKYHRVERAYGQFSRSFKLPDTVDAEKVEAEFKDGLLRIHLAKVEKSGPRQIEVKAE
ncbi:Hsp20/alpha crystallin family protein [Luteolibacter luteus]|uniref:Hsp20/alpha crystallin family protein n=1 Tax=Luteolibacter luteus TaxID=2728835 RepID=A0A858RQ60_9BACT|nr:Hsp20/alpha crystallin family protein [Luteolibacter luteus]QJE98865.1 Hsp20/alpha crystallin family protein [Luteolibacter luteus]